MTSRIQYVLGSLPRFSNLKVYQVNYRNHYACEVVRTFFSGEAKHTAKPRSALGLCFGILLSRMFQLGIRGGWVCAFFFVVRRVRTGLFALPFLALGFFGPRGDTHHGHQKLLALTYY